MKYLKQGIRSRRTFTAHERTLLLPSKFNLSKSFALTMTRRTTPEPILGFTKQGFFIRANNSSSGGHPGDEHCEIVLCRKSPSRILTPCATSEVARFRASGRESRQSLAGHALKTSFDRWGPKKAVHAPEECVDV